MKYNNIIFVYRCNVTHKSLGLVKPTLMFLKEASYAHQGGNYSIKNTIKKYNCEILLQLKTSAVFPLPLY